MATRRSRAVYVISVAADLAGVHPQTLRIYERKGLLQPERTAGNTRRYSVSDIERLARIQTLTQEHGVNLAGVRMILDLESQLSRTRRELDRMADRLQRMESGMAEEMRKLSRDAGAILPASEHKTLRDLWLSAVARGRTPIPLPPIEDDR